MLFLKVRKSKIKAIYNRKREREKKIEKKKGRGNKLPEQAPATQIIVILALTTSRRWRTYIALRWTF